MSLQFNKMLNFKDHVYKPSCIYQFLNCHILRDHKIIKEDFWIRDGKILNPEKIFFEEKQMADFQIDCNKMLISPGFIDLQINGAFGLDFSDDPARSLINVDIVAEKLLNHGVTSFCPTIVTSLPDIYKRIIPNIKKKEGSPKGAGVLGLHLEGPFISKEMKGAHQIECIVNFNEGINDLISVYGSLENVAIITLAPELPEAMEVIRYLTQDVGVVVSLGHSSSCLSKGEEAFKNGANFITHLFNAMLPFHHRDPHLVGLLASENILKNKKVFYGMITDGIHTHPAALKIAHKANPEGLVIVTDAVSAMGLPSGTYKLGNQMIEVNVRKACIAGTNILCGSIATMNDCIKFFYNAIGKNKVESLEAATLHPAQVLNITDKKGTLDYQTDADFVLLTDDLQVKATFIGGQLSWIENDTYLNILT